MKPKKKIKELLDFYEYSGITTRIDYLSIDTRIIVSRILETQLMIRELYDKVCSRKITDDKSK